jgi:pimeloyl-ACP methyl ester carboxylesterase
LTHPRQQAAARPPAGRIGKGPGAGRYEAPRRGKAIVLTLLSLMLASCASPAQHADSLARRGGLHPLVLQGGRFELRGFAATRPPRDPLIVFIDGDGSPWIDGGRRVSADPTPRVPLALDLARVTPGSVLYLGRPCYFELQGPPACSPVLWTSRRYSPQVVASLVAAASRYAVAHRFHRVLLVGYSGGGTLAALMTRSMPDVAGLVTIAGNLDPRAWARWHGYLPLTGSLDPALEPPPPGLPQWHLLGGKDTNVPYPVVAGYFTRVPTARVLHYPGFGHVCCWVRAWPAAIGGILSALPPSAPLSQRPERPRSPARCAGSRRAR